MKALVIGYGSIARRHMRNLYQLHPETTFWVCRNRSLPVEEPYVAQVVTDFDAALAWQPDIAIVASPATDHIWMAQRLAEENVHLLIEKPLSVSLEGVVQLVERVQTNQTALLVGYNFRFYPPLQIAKDALDSGAIGDLYYARAEVGQYLPDWRPHLDYRQAVSAQKQLGGGATLELSHEIDYVRWIVGNKMHSVQAHQAQVSSLELEVEDMVDIILRSAHNQVASLHMDFLQRVPRRSLTLVGSTGTILVDLIQHHVQMATAPTKTWQTLWETANWDTNTMYMTLMQHFMDCVRGKASPIIQYSEAVEVLEIIQATQAAATSGKVVYL